MNLIDKIMRHGMTVYALVGASGSGKSFRAKLIAEKYALSALIDDGLLIQDDKILAGRSAKHEKTYMGAVRVALFDDKEHRDSVARVLQKNKIKKILILGTSEKMVQKIAMRLQLPPPEKIIKIEDVATTEEIQKAITSRNVEGKHVIPVPAIEVKKTYPQIFYNAVRDALSMGRKRFLPGKNAPKLSEKSIVTPEFSKRGRLEISEAALTQMVMHCVEEQDKQIRIKKLAIKTDKQGYRFILTITVPFGKQLTGTIRNLQQYIIDSIERYTGILIEEVSIIVDKITDIEKKEEAKPHA